MKYNDIKWDDEDTGFDEQGGEKTGATEEDFASLLAGENLGRQSIRVGGQVTGTILSINQESGTVLVEVDLQHTGVMELPELINESGEQTHHTGDTITAFVVSRKGGDLELSNSLSRTQKGAEDLRLAYQNKLPVKGRVTSENPGGFDVLVMGKSAFCPVSQIDTRYVTDKAEYVGKEFNFLIEKFEQSGRNLVVSRSALLKIEAEKKIAEIEQKLDQDYILDGTVAELLDFGAIIDLGGLTGFLHISEMSFSRINRASDFLEKGEKVRVKVISVSEKEGKKRISLSMKAAQNDPWLEASSRYEVGQSYQGKVLKLENFGAFVELEPGIEGLIHISEMSWEKRVHHPSDVLSIGDKVSVRLLSMDLSAKRISLSLKHVEEDPWIKAQTMLASGNKLTGQVEQLKGFGAIVRLTEGVTGLIPLGTLKKKFGESYRKKSSPPKELEVIVQDVNQEERKVLLSFEGVESEPDDSYKAFLGDTKTKDKATSSARGSFGDILAAKLKGK